MRTRFAILLVLFLTVPSTPRAEPQVVASIAPVHSLVARVMAGAGTPHLLLPPGASPHDHALRPSDARALTEAGLVVWTGPGIERWLERPLGNLAGDARILRLDQVPGLTRLALREDETFGDHGHEAHEDHGHGHGHEDTDPHLWLDPQNAILWLDAIAQALAGTDPANATLYQANASAGKVELADLTAEIDTRLTPLRGRPFIVLHDAFHYFEHRFEIEAAGAIALSDARPPGPARLARIRNRIAELGIVCLFREPQMRGDILDAVAEGAAAKTGTLDPLGAALTPGPGLYPALLENLAHNLTTCLE